MLTSSGAVIYPYGYLKISKRTAIDVETKLVRITSHPKIAPNLISSRDHCQWYKRTKILRRNSTAIKRILFSNCSRISWKLKQILHRVRRVYICPGGTVQAPKWSPASKWSPTGPEMIPKLGPKWSPNWARNGPQTGPEMIPKLGPKLSRPRNYPQLHPKWSRHKFRNGMASIGSWIHSETIRVYDIQLKGFLNA